MGVNNPKKTIPRTIGLTIILSNSPNLIQSLFNGNKMSALTIVITKNINDVIANAHAHEIVAVLKR